MTQTLLTLVIPAYNVEKYIGACLESVLSQCMLHSVPIVLVIDGATDNTEGELRRTIEKHDYNQVTVITQENQGLSAARNRGLAEVSTEYVAFLDSDDFWSCDYLNRVMPILHQRRPDILEFNASLISEDGSNLDQLKIANVGNGDLASVTKVDFASMFRCYAWARITKTEILRKYLFPVGERFEDAGVVPWHYWSANKIDGLGESLVFYRQHNSSILNNPSDQDVLDLAKSVERASTEYTNTPTDYWQIVTVRLHYLACSRILYQPIKAWFNFIPILNKAIGNTLPTPGVLRWLQIKQTYVYLLMLFVKRRLMSMFDYAMRNDPH